MKKLYVERTLNKVRVSKTFRKNCRNVIGN